MIIVEVRRPDATEEVHYPEDLFNQYPTSSEIAPNVYRGWNFNTNAPTEQPYTNSKENPSLGDPQKDQ